MDLLELVKIVSLFVMLVLLWPNLSFLRFKKSIPAANVFWWSLAATVFVYLEFIYQ